MSEKPYMIYPDTATKHGEPGAKVTTKLFINEPGKVCYGTAVSYTHLTLPTSDLV